MGKWANLKRKLQTPDNSDAKVSHKVQILDNDDDERKNNSSKLARLPVEILDIISNNLTVKDRCNLRKSCKTLANKILHTRAWKTQSLVYRPESKFSDDGSYLKYLYPA